MVLRQPGSCAVGTTEARLVSTLHQVDPTVSVSSLGDRGSGWKGVEEDRGRRDMIVRVIRVVSNIFAELNGAGTSFVVYDSCCPRRPGGLDLTWWPGGLYPMCASNIRSFVLMDNENDGKGDIQNSCTRNRPARVYPHGSRLDSAVLAYQS